MGKGNDVRIQWRSQKGGVRRAYVDLRRWGGPRQVALIPPGETRATTDPVIAKELAQDLLDTLQTERVAERTRAAEAHRRETEAARHAALHGLDRGAELATYAARHLSVLEKERSNSEQWLDATALMLDRAIYFFDVLQVESATPEERDKHQGLRSPRNLAGISAPDVQAYVTWLGSDECWAWEKNRREQAAKGRSGRRAARGGKQGPFGNSHIRHHLNALSLLFRRAISEGLLPSGANPVAGLLKKPPIPKSRTEWLEPPQLALALESARTYDPLREHGGREPLTCAYELLAFMILTGCRDDEARRMDVGHVHLADEYLEIPGTKTEDSDRTMPLHRQLGEILQAYLVRTGRIFQKDAPLFVSDRTGGRVGDARKAFDAITRRAGLPARRLRSRTLRVSYITHRLLSLDEGRPVTTEMVRQEVGHSGSSKMIERVYARVSRRKERLDPFAFRIESYLHMPEIRAAVDLMAEEDSAAAARAAVPKPERDRIETEQRREVIRAFLAAVVGLSSRAVQEATGIAYRTVGRLRTGEQTDARGETLRRMQAHLAARNEQAA
jgi:integrase